MKEINKGNKVRLVLPNNIYYSGIIISEDEHFLTIKDKFQKIVQLNKNHIISCEVIE